MQLASPGSAVFCNLGNVFFFVGVTRQLMVALCLDSLPSKITSILPSGCAPMYVSLSVRVGLKVASRSQNELTPPENHCIYAPLHVMFDPLTKLPAPFCPTR